MLSLIWGLLNIIVFLLAIFLGAKITRYIYAKFGTFAAIFFVAIVLSAAAGANKNRENMEPNSNQVKTWHFLPKDSTIRGSIYLKEKNLDKELVGQYSIGIQYTIDQKIKQPVPISAYSDNTGFVSGKAWQPMGITINKTLDANLFRYNVVGVIKWKLLGIPVYAQDKQYDGVISLTDSHRYLSVL